MEAALGSVKSKKGFAYNVYFSYGYVNIPFMLLCICKSHNLSSSCCKKLDLVVALYSQSLQRYFSPSWTAFICVVFVTIITIILQSFMCTFNVCVKSSCKQIVYHIYYEDSA